MSKDSLAEDTSGLYHKTLEKENSKVAKAQVRRINDTLRKVRKISRDSQRMARPQITLPVGEASIRQDESESFFIPEPTAVNVSALIDRAATMLEEEIKELSSIKRASSGRVIKKWKIV